MVGKMNGVTPKTKIVGGDQGREDAEDGERIVPPLKKIAKVTQSRAPPSSGRDR